MAVHLPLGVVPRRVWPLAILVSGLLAAGCSEHGSAERLPADSPILVEVSQNSVIVQNKAGMALADVSLSIVTYTPVDYSKRIPRIENTERRQILLGDFRSPDGSPFSGRIRAKALRLRAKDVAGKTYEFEVPWS